MNEDSSSETVLGSDGITHQDIESYVCQFMGHYCNQCPYYTGTGAVSMHVGVLCAQEKCFNIPLSCILLNICSTCDVTNNPALVTDIHMCASQDILNAYTNGGKQVYNLIGDLKLLPI